MKKLVILFALLCTIILFGFNSVDGQEGNNQPVDKKPVVKTVNLYISTEGNDTWSGKLQKPENGDGPFATFTRAQKEIRNIKKTGESAAITVIVQEGVYEFPATMQFTKEDSGDKDAPVVFCAAEQGKAVLIGGKKLTGWKLVDDEKTLELLSEPACGKVYQCDLKKQGITDFGQVNENRMELFFNDMPMTISRWPNEGFVQIADVLLEEPMVVHGRQGDKVGKFIYDGDRPERWTKEKDLWLHGYWFWDWSDQRQKVESIDTDKKLITICKPYHHYGYRKGQWYYAFNLLSELDIPGEWYLDRETGVLYFYPPEKIEGSKTIVSILPELFKFNDSSYISFRGFTVEVTRSTPVLIENSSNILITDCLIRNTGKDAVSIQGGSDNGVTGCEITATGSGGIYLIGGDREKLIPANHFAENNNIHHFARWNRMYTPAVSMNGVGMRASHNLIHDAPHQAIFFDGNDHIIEFNEIYNVCEESNDAGAIYSGRDWTMRGTVIKYNYIHDVVGFKNGGASGVYLDDMFCGTLVYGNVFYKVSMPILIGGGRDNIVKNNIFIELKPFPSFQLFTKTSPSVYIDDRATNWAKECADTTMMERLKKMPYQQPPWSEKYPELVNILDDEPCVPKGNVIENNICWKSYWALIMKEGAIYTVFKGNLVNEDPHFVDEAHQNFQLRDDSPAYKYGFERIPFEEIGLIKKQTSDTNSKPSPEYKTTK
ncbi:MAG: right-handed parallel beta-helix repeat-containing protein [Planctomycetota bacterium]